MGAGLNTNAKGGDEGASTESNLFFMHRTCHWQSNYSKAKAEFIFVPMHKK